jgi:uncharacterized protein YkwD
MRALRLALVAVLAPGLLASGPPPEPLAGPSPDAAAILAAHNDSRARHCASPLAWSADLAQTAQRWADRLARSCSLQHSGGRYGENLWAGTAGAFPARQVADAWYGEASKYDFERPGFSMQTGHFTQLVWVGSKTLGCGTATCKGLRIWVCNYDPPGNVEGQFRANVWPRSCRK